MGTMRVLVAGASGAIGRPLLAMLVAAGHDVTGASRSTAGAAAVARLGARTVVVDLLDPAAVAAVLADARPEVVIHQATSLAASSADALTDERLEATSRLREEGTWHLVEAAVAVGARRVVAQSIAWLALAADGPITEETSIEPDDPASMSPTRAGIIALERIVASDPRFDGLVLRYGRLHGPGTWTPTPPQPPTVHVAAAARAAVLAIERGARGIYHVVDDGGQVQNEKARDVLGWTPGPI